MTRVREEGIAKEAASAATDRDGPERGICVVGPTRSTEYDALRSAAQALIAPFRQGAPGDRGVRSRR